MANIIFDFDGTLADTLHIAISGLKKLALTSTEPTEEDIERLRGLSARQVMKALQIPWWRVPRIVYFGRKEVTSQIDSVTTFPGMPTVLHQLRQQGHQLFILSSNSTKNIETFLRNNHLEKYFDGYWGDEGLFAKSAAIKKIVRKQGLELEDCYYIGDEVRDIEAARRAGIKQVSVTWGYNNHKALTKARAAVLVDHPKDLMPFFADKR